MADQVTPNPNAFPLSTFTVPRTGDENIDRALTSLFQSLADQLGARVSVPVTEITGTAVGEDAAVINEIKARLNTLLTQFLAADLVSSTSTSSTTSSSTTISTTSSSTTTSTTSSSSSLSSISSSSSYTSSSTTKSSSSTR